MFLTTISKCCNIIETQCHHVFSFNSFYLNVKCTSQKYTNYYVAVQEKDSRESCRWRNFYSQEFWIWEEQLNLTKAMSCDLWLQSWLRTWRGRWWPSERGQGWPTVWLRRTGRTYTRRCAPAMPSPPWATREWPWPVPQCGSLVLSTAGTTAPPPSRRHYSVHLAETNSYLDEY